MPDLGLQGSVPNRCRLLFELAEAISSEIGSHRLAVRLSPTTIDPTTGIQTQYYYGTTCSDPDDVYAHAVSGLNRFNLACKRAGLHPPDKHPTPGLIHPTPG